MQKHLFVRMYRLGIAMMFNFTIIILEDAEWQIRKSSATLRI